MSSASARRPDTSYMPRIWTPPASRFSTSFSSSLASAARSASPRTSRRWKTDHMLYRIASLRSLATLPWFGRLPASLMASFSPGLHRLEHLGDRGLRRGDAGRDAQPVVRRPAHREAPGLRDRPTDPAYPV